MRRGAWYARYLRVSGWIFAVFGAFASVYALSACVLGFWSADIALALFGLWGVVCLISGCLRLIRKRPLFYFQKPALCRTARAVFALFCAVAVGLQGLVCWGVGRKSEPGAQAVVILGARVYGDQPSLLLRSRIDAAAQYLLENPQACAVACGAAANGGFSEAYVIQKRLVALGVDPSRIYLDEQSADTRQNIQNAAGILRALGVTKAAVATSDYHLWRGAHLLRRAGFEPVCVGAPSAWYLRPIAHFREMLSIARELVFPQR